MWLEVASKVVGVVMKVVEVVAEVVVEVVEFSIFAGGAGGDALRATLYAGHYVPRASLFEGGVRGAGGDALCATLYAGRVGRDALCAALYAGGCALLLEVLDVLEVPEASAVMRCVLLCMLDVMRHALLCLTEVLE